MDALFQLCDLIVQNPPQFGEKLAWICGRCPSPASLLHGSPKASKPELNAVLAIARFLSQCPDYDDHRPKSVILAFFRAIPSSFDRSFWPQSFGINAISSFFHDFLHYFVKSTEISAEFSSEVTRFSGDVVMHAISNAAGNSSIHGIFLTAFCENFPPILQSDAEKLIMYLLDHYIVMVPASPRDMAAERSEISSVQSSPVSSISYQPNEVASPGNEQTHYSSSAGSRYPEDAMSTSSRGSLIMNGIGHPWKNGGGVISSRRQIASWEEESFENLQKQEIACKLIGHVLEKVRVDSKLLEEVRIVSKKQLQLLSVFLKLRRRDWTENGTSLKTRINMKLSIYLAVANLQVKCFEFLEADGKSSKRLLLENLALFIDAAESCLLSVWRKLRISEELFSCLLVGIYHIATARGGQLLRVLLIRLKPLVLTACAQSDAWGGNPEVMFECVMKTVCEIIEYGWVKDRSPVDTFIMGLATSVREQNDYEEEDGKVKQSIPLLHLNVVRLLVELNVYLNKAELIDMILPLFIEILEERGALTPSMLRLCLIDALSRMASLGFEKSYRETVVLMTRSYLSKLSNLGSAENSTLAPEASMERIETLPAGFLTIASCITDSKLRSDYRHRLLSLCSDVGLAAESKSGRSGADFLGPLLPAVAEICYDFDPVLEADPSLLKLFRNLWFYIALFGLAPPIQQNQSPVKSVSTTLNSIGSMTTIALQAVSGPYMWNVQWSSAVQRIAQGTPPLVVSSVKWLEDELELNALHNPGSRRGSGNEKAAFAQRAALSAALGGRIDAAAMGTISGVKATYLLAVAFLEIIRFSSNGGMLNGGLSTTASRSAFSCVFEYLKTPNLMPAVFQCLTAIVHGAFETAVAWLENRTYGSGPDAEISESTLSAHACFLIKNMSQREEHVRNVSVNLLIQLRDKFPQLLWNSCCLDTLLFSLHNDLSSTSVIDPALVATVRSLYQRIVREWLICSLSHAPCTCQGLLQEKLCKANNWQRAQPTADVVSLLSEMRIGTGKNECWSGVRTANIPAVMAAAAAASGANLKLMESFNLEVLSTGMVSATVKCNHAGEIAGMRRLYNSLGGFNASQPSTGFGLGFSLQRLRSSASQQAPPENDSFNEILLSKFVRMLQQFVNIAEKGLEVDKLSFRETCSQATALLLSNLTSDSKPKLDGFSQLLRLLCWCPAYISTPDVMEIGVFIWTWIVSAAPELGSVVLAELVDAWLWTIDTKRGIFASEVRYSGPVAKLRPHLTAGEPETCPEKNHTEQIISHRLWLGFLIDRFEVTRHTSIEQLLLFGRLLQGTTREPWSFSHHPVATGTFFTLMLLGLKFSHQLRKGLSNCGMSGQLLEDRIFQASLLWFAHEPEWYDIDSKNFSQNESLSVSSFLQFLSSEIIDPLPPGIIKRGYESDTVSIDTKDDCHPAWGERGDYAAAREKQKQLLLLLCQHEADRLEVWAQPTNSKDGQPARPKISSDKWVEHARTAFFVDPRIAFCLSSRFPMMPALRAEVTLLAQLHILDIRCIPEALPHFVTPKAVEENSALLKQLPHWASCSITQALEFLRPAYRGHPRLMAYVLRVLESYPPERVTFFMPQLVQALRYDDGMLVEGYLMRAAQRSDIFAHILIWHLQGETFAIEAGKDFVSSKNNSFQAVLPILRQKIIDRFGPKALDLFEREFRFFDKVTSISGILFPLPKEERRAGIKRELEKIEVEGVDLYLPTAPNKLVRSIRVDSGIPLQSAAKVPIMITFNVVDRDGNPSDIKPQACIFKVGDDCRQDVLALQVIALLRDIFEAVGLSLYLFPYGVLPTGPERGIIEVVPNTRSRSQMGETTDGGLYEIFQQDYGPVGCPTFEAARDNFIISSAGYAVASLLLQPKDRHNGNLLFDNEGRLVHIDFGFILETSPGGNMRFESADFKLSHEMTQLLDPSGAMKSETWNRFVSLCVKGYLVARQHANGIVNTVLLMIDSGLPCFSRGDPIGNLRKRFHPEMTEREAANFMIRTCTDAYNKWTTAGYDLIQYLQQGIEK